MQNIQITIDENLLTDVDKLIKTLNMTRSAFIRDSLKLSIKRHQIIEMERQHIEGYKKHPVKAGEFDIWHEEQVWE